jgi:FAD:protein FMN transferase
MSPVDDPASPAPVAKVSRRRAINILGAVAGLPLLCALDRARNEIPIYQWHGSSLGSPSRLMIYHADRAAARELVSWCVTEITRLERVFALYQRDSELVRLNRDGRLEQPSLDLLTVLSQAMRLSDVSDGAFDVTVQPLWEVYSAHFFGTASPSPAGPPLQAIERARALVDWRSVDVTSRQVALARKGMALTLNGIAQGYVTDRITEILRDNGCDRILADLGCSEIRALGRHNDGRPWRVALSDPRNPEQSATTLELCDRALCTSGGYGTPFEATGKFHHLFDPATGTSANHNIAVSVLAPSAMVADALSTTLYVLAPERAPSVLGAFPAVQALLTRPDGSVGRLPS